MLEDIKTSEEVLLRLKLRQDSTQNNSPGSMETFREKWKRSKGKTWGQKSQSEVEKDR